MNIMANESELLTIHCEYEGKIVQLNIDNDTYKEVISDNDKLQDYCQRVVSLQQNNEASTSHNPSDDGAVKWSHSDIKLLLNIRLGKETDFNRPTCKKKKLWGSIADEINKITGRKFTSDDCDTKYRNLLKTYKINKKKQNTSGEEAIKWEFFKDFDQVLGTKACIVPPKSTIFDSLEEEEETENIDFPVEEASVDKDISQPKKRKLTLNNYLWEKLKQTEERANRKEQQEEKRWVESKALREREIEAILKLAEALKKN